MIAAERNGSAGNEVPHKVDDVAGIGSVADVVAEEDHSVGPGALRMRKAGVDGLAVSVDVGEKRDQHRRRLAPLKGPVIRGLRS